MLFPYLSTNSPNTEQRSFSPPPPSAQLARWRPRAHSQVKILPTVICFNDGVAVHNIIGFDGLTAGLPADKLDEWPLSNLARELALAKVCTQECRWYLVVLGVQIFF